MSIPLALRLGWEGLDEALELDLTKEGNPGDLMDTLNRTLPEGIRILSVRLISPGRRSPPLSASYRITLSLDEDPIRQGVESAPAIPGLLEAAPGLGVLDFTVSLDRPRPPKPVEVVEALLPGLSCEPWMFTRTRILFADMKETA